MNVEAIVRYEEAARQLREARKIGMTDEEIIAAARRQHSIARRLQDPGQPVTVISVGRNERCPCGSGDKYKWCCADDPDYAEALTRPNTDRADREEAVAVMAELRRKVEPCPES